MTAVIEARFVHRYGADEFVLDVDVALPGVGVTALFGPSGSGKTTFLRCVAGLTRAAPGTLVVAGESWQDDRSFLAVHRRPVAYVFQEASLFPHLTVAGNLEYAETRARRRGPPIGVGDPSMARETVIDTLDIARMLERRPSELSGGERQRVAIGRALMAQPRLLLMDEPLAALDRARRAEILPLLVDLRERLSIPILYVSHAADEVARLADHVVFLDEGRVVDAGPVFDMLSRLDSPVLEPAEAGVLLDARIEERDERWHLVRVSFAGGSLWVRDSGDQPGAPSRLRVLARDVSLARQRPEATSILNVLEGAVDVVREDRDAAMALVTVVIGESRLVARLTRRSVSQLALVPGVPVWAQVKSVAIVR